MPRSRNINPAFFKNEELAMCEPRARLMFVALWCDADRDGRLLDRPFRLKAEYFPYDNCDAEHLIAQLAGVNLIERYEVDGCKYIAIPNFLKYQTPHINEKSKDYPVPALCMYGASTVQVPCKHDTSTAGMMNDELGMRNQESCLTEGGASVLEFPVSGKGGPVWKLTEAKLLEYQEAFPHLDVMGQLRIARQWCIDNPAKRKTRGGMPAFLTRWLGRAQDSGKASSPPAPRQQMCQVPTDEDLAAWNPYAND